jgi:hypothetical protein
VSDTDPVFLSAGADGAWRRVTLLMAAVVVVGNTC